MSLDRRVGWAESARSTRRLSSPHAPREGGSPHAEREGYARTVGLATAPYSVRAIRAIIFLIVGCAGLGIFLPGRADDSSVKTALAASLRRPVALVLADEGKWLFAANRASIQLLFSR